MPRAFEKKKKFHDWIGTRRSLLKRWSNVVMYLICVRRPPWWGKRVWGRGASSWPCWAASWSAPCSSSGSWWPASCTRCRAGGIDSRFSPLSVYTHTQTKKMKSYFNERKLLKLLFFSSSFECILLCDRRESIIYKRKRKKKKRFPPSCI